MTTITSEELWEEVETNQQWLDTLREQPGTEELRAEAAESVAENLMVLHRLARLAW